MGGPTELGKAIELSLADPWDVAERARADRIEGTIIGVHEFDGGAETEAIAVRLENPLVWRERSYPIVIVTARHGQGLLEALSDTSDVECNYISTTDDAVFRGEDIARRLETWRGGLAGRAAVRLRS